MQYFPFFFDLRDKTILVVGGGAVAQAKLRLLLKSEAHFRVVAKELQSATAALCEPSRVSLHTRAVSEADLDGVDMIFCATGDEHTNTQVAAWAKARRILINVVDTPEACDFITPAIVDRAPLTVAIGTEGAGPVLARVVKAKIEELLPHNLGAVALGMRAVRKRWQDLPEAVRRGRWRGLYQRLLDAFNQRDLLETLQKASEAESTLEPAKVVFIGAGPGEAELLTLKGKRWLQRADVVIYDRLVGQGVLEYARREAQLVCVGKAPDAHSWTQDQINALLQQEAKPGQLVVRLKGGDTAVFARLDEELDALAGLPVETLVVPGVTSASAAAASAKVSLTQRGRNAALSFLTAQLAKGYAEHQWRALAQPGQCFAIYMGRKAARFVQGRLLLHGMNPDTPVTLVESASQPSERVLSSTLAKLHQPLEALSPGQPLMILMGIEAREGDQQAGLTLPELPQMTDLSRLNLRRQDAHFSVGERV